MKPENILQSDVIDIIFENKNKEYGAYELRKQYGRRMNKSIGITALIVLVFALSQSFKVPKRTGSVVLESIDSLKFTQVILPKDEPKVKQQEPEKLVQKKNAATASYIKPIVVPDELANKPISTIDKIETSIISGQETEGEAVTTEVGITKDKPTEGKGNVATEPVEEEVSNAPLNIAEFMPEFPGGQAAFIKFLQRNLNQPSDFEEGEKVTVIAKFVVNAEGNIVDIDIIKNGRSDLDQEVIRVIKKMPRWKAGMQNGRAVPVYYKVPITFVSAD